MNGFSIIIPSKPYITEGIPANSSTAGFTIAASCPGATSAMNTAVRTPIGTPINTANAVPMIEVSITYRIPYLGSAAVGAHCVSNRISFNQILKIAGVPFNIM